MRLRAMAKDCDECVCESVNRWLMQMLEKVRVSWWIEVGERKTRDRRSEEAKAGRMTHFNTRTTRRGKMYQGRRDSRRERRKVNGGQEVQSMSSGDAGGWKFGRWEKCSCLEEAVVRNVVEFGYAVYGRKEKPQGSVSEVDVLKEARQPGRLVDQLTRAPPVPMAQHPASACTCTNIAPSIEHSAEWPCTEAGTRHGALLTGHLPHAPLGSHQTAAGQAEA